MPEQRDEHSTARRVCCARARCHNWRDCASCGRIRQAKVADMAQRLASMYPTLSWAVIEPHRPGAGAIEQARDEWRRIAKPGAGIWTIEQSKRTGNLHLNIISNSTAARSLSAAECWQQRIVGDPRNVAAYISKPSQAPARSDHHGRLLGTLGPLWQYLAHERQAPAVAAAAIQHALDPKAAEQRARIAAYISGQPEPHTQAEYRAIASRYLPDLIRARELLTSRKNER